MFLNQIKMSPYRIDKIVSMCVYACVQVYEALDACSVQICLKFVVVVVVENPFV